MKAVRAPLRSISALVASVVPWITRSTSAGFTPASLSACAMPCSTACSGARGVVRTLVVTERLPIWTAMSVKVPPISTPTRTSPAGLAISYAFSERPTPVASQPCNVQRAFHAAVRVGSSTGEIGFSVIGTTLRIARRAAMAVLNVNGKSLQANADPRTPLLWVLRDTLGMTGTKYGCGIAQCGACTVHIDGVATRSCQVPLSAAASGKKIVTIEGLAQDGKLNKIQQAWLDNDVPQCGYCQSGMIMAATALLAAKPNPTDADIDAAMTNICRCGTYQQVREAIHAAAKA